MQGAGDRFQQELMQYLFLAVEKKDLGYIGRYENAVVGLETRGHTDAGRLQKSCDRFLPVGI
jgi:hypothetical protein